MGLVRAVARSFERGIGPLRLAETLKSPQVGLLLETESPKHRSTGAIKVMLTIDLTPAVVEEALNNDTGVIVAYHPPIFSGLKSLTLTNPLQRSLLRCAAEGISIFSPHTALDSVRGGVSCIDATLRRRAENLLVSLIGEEKEGGAGAGRLITLSEPVSLETLCKRVKAYCGLNHCEWYYVLFCNERLVLTRFRNLSKVQLGVPPEAEPQISTIAICAGSGGSLLKGVKADAYLTGEMSHHEVLAAVAQGGHSNTERPYLPTLQKKLQQALDDDEELAGESYDVVISKADADPLKIVKPPELGNSAHNCAPMFSRPVRRLTQISRQITPLARPILAPSTPLSNSRSRIQELATMVPLPQTQVPLCGPQLQF
ncbi:NIF3 domain-containing protein [Rhizoctonia solani AG-1 IA]|uniref:NIF3 domain-containing protein n=1 Tax=Thanatephorus cucumeris (strain AG1-IA) TaxID=983506 RepID=L8X637_THACA|nr:NIF3 domain-containing protein [Rhizoctonia solani AG-1 IA]